MCAKEIELRLADTYVVISFHYNGPWNSVSIFNLNLPGNKRQVTQQPVGCLLNKRIMTRLGNLTEAGSLRIWLPSNSMMRMFKVRHPIVHIELTDTEAEKAHQIEEILCFNGLERIAGAHASQIIAQVFGADCDVCLRDIPLRKLVISHTATGNINGCSGGTEHRINTERIISSLSGEALYNNIVLHTSL